MNSGRKRKGDELVELTGPRGEQRLKGMGQVMKAFHGPNSNILGS